MYGIKDDFKTYEGYENMAIIEDLDRDFYWDSVIKAFDSYVMAEDYVNINDLWGCVQLLVIDESGIAYYPEI